MFWQTAAAAKSGWFQDKFYAAGEKALRFHRFGITDRNHVVHQLTDRCEGMTSQMLGLRTICDRLRYINMDNWSVRKLRCPSLPASGSTPIIAPFELKARAAMAQPDSNPPPLNGTEEHIQVTGILNQLLRCRSLTRDHMGDDRREESMSDQVLPPDGARGFRGPRHNGRKNYFAAIGSSGSYFISRRVTRHDDNRFDALKPR